MRPPRVIIVGVFFVTTVFLTYTSLRSSHGHKHTIVTEEISHDAGIFSFLSVRAPFSLFPPSAIITLTHDNTTVFLARPAAFGPQLPNSGLKGQLWIGSGFGDESIRQPLAAGAEGETGCGDVPGWSETYSKSSNAAVKKLHATGGRKMDNSRLTPKKRSLGKEGPFKDDATAKGNMDAKQKDDGTDDYLHQEMPVASSSSESQPAGLSSDHADIQSIQEGAEIAGKVVLLSRGDCGFLEKVKWAQRRGAIALIVGDNTIGGPLIQMYARGDTSNVTIPSIFTSRTTAHLLSSLMGPGAFIEDTLDEQGQPLLKVKQSEKKQTLAGPTFTATKLVVKATVVPRKVNKSLPKKSTHVATSIKTERPGWFRAMFLGVGKNQEAENSRPPSSGQHDWVLVDNWKEAELIDKKKPAKPKKNTETSNGKQGSKDDFVIGVQDWRDKDLVSSKNGKESGKDVKDVGKTSNAATKGTASKAESDASAQLRGGSTTPGSGEYSTTTKENGREHAVEETNPTSKGFLNTIFGEDEEDVEFPHPAITTKQEMETTIGQESDEEGLWVTLTPTSGASPFLDTLLVLVVSPLVTLTVVYALLLIRSRIRRRRWRAPKSVVERLPVRTYQTAASTSSGTQTPRQSHSPGAMTPSVTTPLLQRSPSPSRSRPRSRTTSGIPEPGEVVRVNSSPLQVPVIPARLPEHEKNASTESQWKKYMGKQVECVVCLEEYVEGVSRVMSLPCGHEFHADCM